MALFINQLNEQNEVRETNVPCLPSTKPVEELVLASLLGFVMDTLCHIDEKIKGAKEVYANKETMALYKRDMKEVASLQAKQEATFKEISKSLTDLKAAITEKSAFLDTLEGEEKAQAIKELKEYVGQLQGMINREVGILPKDEAGMLPIIPGNGQRPGTNPPGAAPIDTVWMMRQIQMQQLLQELLAMLDEVERGATGYPIGYIFAISSVAVIEIREAKAAEIAAKQQILNDVTSRVNEFLYLLRQIQNGATGEMPIEEATKRAEDLQESLVSLIGHQANGEVSAGDRGWYFDTEGNFVPGEGSEMQKLISSLGPNFRSNPLYGVVNRLMQELNGNDRVAAGRPPVDGDDTSFGDRPRLSFLRAITGDPGRVGPDDKVRWVRMMEFNYHHDQVQTPNHRDGTPFLERYSEGVAAIQQSAGTVSQQTTMMMQQEMADIGVFSDIAKKGMESMDTAVKKTIGWT